MCRTKGVKAIDAKDSKAFMGVIKQSRTSNPWSITLLVNGTPVDFKIDTGADVTVISDSIHQGIPHSTLQPPTKSLSGAASKNLEVSGQFSASLKYKDKEADEEVRVAYRGGGALGFPPSSLSFPPPRIRSESNVEY